MRCSRFRSKSPIDVGRTESTPSASGMAMLAVSVSEGIPATGLPEELTKVSPRRAYRKIEMGVPSFTLGVIVPIRSALAALVLPLGVRYLDRDTRPVAAEAVDVIESSKLCAGR